MAPPKTNSWEVRERIGSNRGIAAFFRGGVLGVLALLLLAAAAPASPRPFIRVDGTRFMEGDRPFHFVGANLNVMHEPHARQSAAVTIAAVARDGLRVGRIWALGEGLRGAPPWLRDNYLFRAGPKGWQEQAYRHLDQVIAEAGKRGLRLIVTLSNAWGDYGGIPMYLRWAGQVDVETYGYSDRFFTHPKCRAWFKEHALRIVRRTNSVTGVSYRDDPTIMAWELQNEMNGTPEAAVDRRRWVQEMARAIREVDPNHLIVPGVIGYALEVERRDWILMNQLPEVSYCDQHVYPEEHLRSRGLRNMRLYIDDRVQLAHHVVGKPMVFGEFGFSETRDLAARENWHRLFLERVFFDGADGALVWIYQPTLPWKRDHSVLVDRPRYRGLRRVLGEWARRVETREVTNRNGQLGAEAGDRPIAPTHAMLTGVPRTHRRWMRDDGRLDRVVLDIGVDRFRRAWFEEAGSWDGGVLVHAYGRRTGYFEYQFAGPAFVPSRIEVRARLSSEYPGRSAPPHGFSQVRMVLDGVPFGAVRVMPDDGVGAWYTVSLTDRGLLARIRRGVHVLRFEVGEGPEANGIAIYGREAPLNREPVDDPGPMQVIAYR